MTSRQLFEYALIELNKVSAPSLLLEDYNYMINKAVNHYINKKYNIYDYNQQSSDDLRVLKSTCILNPQKSVEYNSSLFDSTYEVTLPSDYLHILNCICQYELVNKKSNCDVEGSEVFYPASRLTSDLYAGVIHNAYNKPSYKKPYYFIHNVNTSSTNPTNPYTDNKGTDVTDVISNSAIGGVPNVISLKGKDISSVDKVSKVRYGNYTPVRLEIRCGKDDKKFILNKVFIDYIKTPQHINITQAELDTTEDTSQILEWQDYVCYEIINELVILLMENSSDPRLQTNIPINQTIASPTQQQS